MKTILLLLAASACALGQNATLSGVIKDSSGAVLPSATVTVTAEETGIKRVTASNNEGIYTAPGLAPGVYTMTVQAKGFRTEERGGLRLEIAQGARLDFELKVGDAKDTVTVTGDSLLINSSDASVSTVVNRELVETLPLNGRSLQTLILLTPGTVMVNGVASNYGEFSVNGQRANANSFMLDGTSANVAPPVAGYAVLFNGANPALSVTGGTGGLVPVDALQEFRIQTSTYAPEYGRQPGGQVSLTTRSGTNQFHGSAFDYLRNGVLDANDWFNNQQGFPKGQERQNDFGGTLGGPIFKDRTFFFFSYESLRLLQPRSGVARVPSLRLRQETAPNFQPILNAWPIPTGSELTDANGNPTGGAPYTLSVSEPTNSDSLGIRVDHTLGSHLHLFGRYAYSPSSTEGYQMPNQFGEHIHIRSTTLGADVNISPRLNNEIRLNYTSDVSAPAFRFVPFGGGKAFDTSILFPAPASPATDSDAFLINLPNFNSDIVVGAQVKYTERQVNAVDNLSYAVGRHQLKVGADYRRLLPVFLESPHNAFFRVNSESDLAAGIVSRVDTGARIIAHPIYVNFSAYGEDIWKVSTRLTLTYGLRWDVNPAPGERDGIQPVNVLGLGNPATATLAPLNTPLYKTTYGNFAPRLGVAWQARQSPGRETVLRVGSGIFYDLNSETASAGFHEQLPFQAHLGPLEGIPFPAPANSVPYPALPAPITTPYSYIGALDPHLKLPYTVQWNVALEQAFGRDQTLTIGYVGAAGYRLLRQDELFNFSPLFTEIEALRNSASSSYNALQVQYKRRMSSGLEALASYTWSHSLDTASNAESYLATAPSGTSFLNPNIDRGDSAFDTRQAFRAAISWTVPAWNVNAFTKRIVGGWSINTIALAQSALPVDLTGNYYYPDNGLAFAELRPNVVAGQPLYIYGSSLPGGRAFNPAAFSPVQVDANGNPLQAQGTLGRDVLRGFNGWQIDLAVQRQFNLAERLHLQVRGELFNVLNHPNFGCVDGFLGDGSYFGQSGCMLNQDLGGYGGAGLNYLYQIGGPRSAQLALKLLF